MTGHLNIPVLQSQSSCCDSINALIKNHIYINAEMTRMPYYVITVRQRARLSGNASVGLGLSRSEILSRQNQFNGH